MFYVPERDRTVRKNEDVGIRLTDLNLGRDCEQGLLGFREIPEHAV